MSEYLLGTSDEELARLRFQQEVWGDVSERFLDRLEIGAGMRVLDAGCGPGLMSLELRERVGASGSVLAVDVSARWEETLRGELAERGVDNVEFRRSRLEDLEAEAGSFDLVFSRWVLSFLPDVEGVIARLAGLLKPGGRLAIQDYNHEGLSLFPKSAGFQAMIRATREYYDKSGGDTWVAGRLPAAMRAAGLDVVDVTPNVKCGGPDSPAFRWADTFFPIFSRVYHENGLVTDEELAGYDADWAARKADPSSLFFSPIVVDVAGRK
jgi:ubiquinone/menaquinone biosynthesis C-methylase UbiE